MKTPTDLDGMGGDYELMSDIAKNRPEALAELHDRYHCVLHHTAMQIVHDSADADEIVQDVFTHLWTHPHIYCAQKGKPLSWILTLSRRRAIDCVRRRQTYQRASERFHMASHSNHRQAQFQLSVDRMVSQDDLRKFLLGLLSQLPAPQQVVLEKNFFRQMSQRQIAAALGSPLGTIKTRIELGLRKLSHLVASERHKLD